MIEYLALTLNNLVRDHASAFDIEAIVNGIPGLYYVFAFFIFQTKALLHQFFAKI